MGKFTPTLDEALRKADAKGAWDTFWNDPEKVKQLQKDLNSNDEKVLLQASNAFLSAWPAHWRSGVVNAGGHSGDEIKTKALKYTFPELLDLLLDEVLGELCRNKNLINTQWVALVPQEQLNGDGRGIGRYWDKPQTQDHWIPWEWWRPFLGRLEERMGLEVTCGQKRQEGELSFNLNMVDFNMDITRPGSRKTMRFTVKILIDRMPGGQEAYCVMRPDSGQVVQEHK